jgi:hypothetical protein
MAAAVWTQARIMVEEDDYVVLNKPPGVQVTPTVDNLLESCLTLGAKVRASHPANNFASHPNTDTISFAVISLWNSIHGLCDTFACRPSVEKNPCSLHTGLTHAQKACSSWGRRKPLCSGSMQQ